LAACLEQGFDGRLVGRRQAFKRLAATARQSRAGQTKTTKSTDPLNTQIAHCS
jgi:hypothetical protein